MKVFVEAERGSTIRYRYNESTFQLEKSNKLLKDYPYAYGFVVGSNTKVLDSLDCFIVNVKTTAS
jgi:inorganic pyrophosphatase